MTARLFALFAIGMLFASNAFAAGDTTVIDNYITTLGGLIDDKMGAIAITLIMIASGVMAWKNASWGPLGWGAAGSVLIAGATSIGGGLAGIDLSVAP